MGGVSLRFRVLVQPYYPALRQRLRNRAALGAAWGAKKRDAAVAKFDESWARPLSSGFHAGLATRLIHSFHSQANFDLSGDLHH